MTTADAEPRRFQRTAHAKINLCLHVTGQRADGYHTLDSLVSFAALGDRISIDEATSDGFEAIGPFASGLMTEAPEQNLVVKARDWLRNQHRNSGEPTCPVTIKLEKHLPISSGVGGGSADAAATLQVLARLWRTPPHLLEHYEAIAAALGADVPMCLSGTPLRATGIGDRVAPWHHVPLLPCVLVNPNIAVSTPAVFKALDERQNAPLDGMPPPFSNVSEAADWLASNTRNDLQEPAQRLCPAINDCLSALNETGAQMARMSGSGATCFGLFETVSSAQASAATIAQEQPGWFVKATALLPSPPQRDEDYETWVESMKIVRSLH